MEQAAVQATEHDVQQAFEGGFAGESPQPIEKPVEKPAVETPEKQAAAEVAAPDPWKDVAPVVRQTLEAIKGSVAELPKFAHRLSSYEGRLGGMQTALDAAKAATKATGAPAPSDKQVSDASQSGEKWKQMKTDFPEWAEAMDERLAALPKPSAAAAPVDVEALRKEWAKDMGLSVSQSAARTRELGRLDVKHENWEETINTPDFIAWSHKDGPTEAERLHMKGLENTAPQDAAQYLSGLMRKYPQWWGERGSLIHSDSAKDAGKLLDSYAASKKAAVDDGQKKKVQDKRLEGALTPQGVTTAASKTQMTAEEAFEKGFSGKG